MGESPDARMRRAMQERGLRMPSKAQQFKSDHLNSFDYIVVADPSIMDSIQDMRQRKSRRGSGDESTKSSLLYMTDFLRKEDMSLVREKDTIPDPYYCGNFSDVVQMLEGMAQNLLSHIAEEQGLSAA